MGPDLVVVFCDWLGMSLTLFAAARDDDGAGGLKMLRFAKLSRALRIISMLRMIKVFRLAEEFAEKYFSESVRMALKICYMIGFALWLSHLMGCVWFATGNMDASDTNRHWIDDEFLE